MVQLVMAQPTHTQVVEHVVHRAQPPRFAMHAHVADRLQLRLKCPLNSDGAPGGLLPHGPHGSREVVARRLVSTGSGTPTLMLLATVCATGSSEVRPVADQERAREVAKRHVEDPRGDYFTEHNGVGRG